MTDNYDDYLFYGDDYEEISDWDEEPDINQEYQDNYKTFKTISIPMAIQQELRIQPTKESNILKNIELSTSISTVVTGEIHELQNDMNTDKYGLSNETVILLCKKKVNINAMIKYHGIKCSLFHAAIYCYHSIISMKIPFSNFLTLHKPIIDLKDEYGRSALTLSVWHLSTSLLITAHDAKIVRALIEYGFNPFLKFRGIRIVDKLRKIKERHYKQQIQQKINGRRSFSIKNTLNKSMVIIDDILCKITYKIQQMECIHIGLHNLVNKNILICEIGKIITNYVGICDYGDYVPPKPKTRKGKTQLKANTDIFRLHNRLVHS